MTYDVKEELANSISHGFGVLFGFCFLPLLFISTYQGEDGNLMALILYSFGFIFIFLSSSLYHISKDKSIKRKLQIVDHIAIYFMIAGTYTPFIFECLDEPWSWIFFSIMWCLVLCGTIFKLFYTGRFEKVSLILYLAMGWMVVFIAKPFISHFDSKIIVLVALGGLSYTVGTYFYSKDGKPYFHFIWHLFVLAGALFHFWAIYSFSV